MITEHELGALLMARLPGCDVETRDRTGTQDHYNVRVRWHGFAGVPLIDQHRMVYAALDGPLKDGRLHAVEITTQSA